MKKRPSLTGAWIKAALPLLCFFIFLSAPAAASGSSSADQHFSNSYLSAGNSPRMVLQVIDGTLHKWIEYPDAADRKLSVLLLEPQIKALDDHETGRLLAASKEWEKNLLLTGLPASQIWPNNLVDDRTAVDHTLSSKYPYYTIGMLAVDFASEYIRGTGFLISPYTVLTNAHNLYSTALGGRYKTARFSPGQYETIWPESYRPFSTKEASKAEINHTFLRYESFNDRDNLIRHDYAALFFDQAFEDINTFMPLQFNQVPDFVSVVGYPGFIRGLPSQGQWLAEGRILFQNENCLFYDALTSGGSSGSPVIAFNQTAGTYRVVAIHSFAYENQQVSGGPHLNSFNLEQIEGWLRWTPDEQAETLVMLTLDKTSLVLDSGAIEMLILQVTPAEFLSAALIWTSSDNSVATVSSSGLVTAHNSGRAIISVKTADGSAAAYCEVTVRSTSGITYPVSSSMPGDLNGDRMINILDVTLAQQHVLRLRILPDTLIGQADVNGDGLVDVRDVSLIMRRALGLVSGF